MGLSGLDVGRRAVVGQVRVGLLTQRRIAASIDPRLLPTPDAVPRSALRAPSSADDGPRVDGQEAIGPRGSVAKRSPFLANAAPSAATGLAIPPARPAAGRAPSSAADGPEEAALARVPVPTAKSVHAVGQAVHVRLVATTGDTPRLRVDGPTSDVLPAVDPTNARPLLVRTRQAATAPVEEAGAAIGGATKARLRPRQATYEAKRLVVVADGPILGAAIRAAVAGAPSAS